MAVALKSAVFRSAVELCDFAANPANNVTTIVDIEIDGSGRFIIFYT